MDLIQEEAFIVGEFAAEDSGQGMVEYGLILVLVAVTAMGALALLGQNSIRPMYEQMKTMFPE